MTSQQILQSDLLDILFENRNKQYGAYHLRRTYYRQMIKAVVLTISMALLLLLLIQPDYSEAAPGNDEARVVVVEGAVALPEQKKPEPPKPPQVPKTQVRQQTFIDNIQITPKPVLDQMPTQDMLLDAAVASSTTEGDPVGTLQPQVAPESKEPAAAGKPTEPEEKELAPDKQPQFPGGMDAWVAFLNRNLHSPAELEPGEKRVVVIRFHVAEDGSVTNFRVERSAGAAFDEEVMRVLEKMPKWTPALQAGRPVSVSFTQPVTFIGMEE